MAESFATLPRAPREVVKLAREFDPDGVRTLGVVTKCDDAAHAEASDIVEKDWQVTASICYCALFRIALASSCSECNLCFFGYRAAARASKPCSRCRCFLKRSYHYFIADFNSYSFYFYYEKGELTAVEKRPCYAVR